jgi:hypothetical protein
MVRDVNEQCKRPVGPATGKLMEEMVKQAGKKLIH